MLAVTVFTNVSEANHVDQQMAAFGGRIPLKPRTAGPLHKLAVN